MGLIFHLAASFDAHYCFKVALIVDVHGGAGVQNLVKHGFNNIEKFFSIISALVGALYAIVLCLCCAIC